MRNYASDCRKSTTFLRIDMYLSVEHNRNIHLTISQIATEFATAAATRVSTRTIYQRLNEVSLNARTIL